MNPREYLAQADWHIDMTRRQVVRQREVVNQLAQAGNETTEANSMLQAMETGLHAYERHRQRIIDRLDRIKEAEKQAGN